MQNAPDRVVDTVGGVAALGATGFLPVDLETWAIVIMSLSAAAYYGVRACLAWKDRNKKK